MDKHELELDKPPSPVLSRNKFNRKHVLTNKLKKKINRVKLFNPFSTFSTSSDDTLEHQALDVLDSIEQLERDHNEDSSSGVVECKNGIFKELLPHAQHLHKCQLAVSKGGGVSEEYFQLASGKNICLSQEAIKKQSDLFKDILQPHNSTVRSNKHSFLNKRGELVCEKSQSYYGPAINVLNMKMKESGSPFKGFPSGISVRKVEYYNALIKYERKSIRQIQKSYRGRKLFDQTNFERCKGVAKNRTLGKNRTNKVEGEFRGFSVLEYNHAVKAGTQFTQNLKVFETKRQPENKVRVINDRKSDLVSDMLTPVPSFPKFDRHEFARPVGMKTFPVRNSANVPAVKTIQQCFDFTTASGTGIKTEPNLIIQAKTSCKGIELSDVKDFMKPLKMPPSQKCHGFTSASGKSVKIEPNCLSSAQRIFKDIELSDISIKNTLSLDSSLGGVTQAGFGFSTASGRNIKVPVGFFERAKRIFTDIDIEDSESSTMNEVNFTSTSGSSVQIAKAGPFHAKKVKDIDNVADLFVKNAPSSLGFSTASGKSLNISEKALAQAHSLFNEIEDGDQTQKQIAYSKPHFTTGTGRTISASTSSLKVAQDKSKDLDLTLTNTALLPLDPTYDQCKPESDVKKKVIKDRNNATNLVGKSAPSSLGFSTASGQSLNISEKALAQAHSLFNEIEDGDGTQKQMAYAKPHFTTGTGRTITASTSSLKAAKDKSKGLDLTLTNTPLPLLDPNYDQCKPENDVKITRQETVAKVNESVAATIGKSASFPGKQQRKKTLGISPYRPVKVSGDRLHKARLFFEDDKSLSLTLTKTCHTIPAPKPSFCSTPLKANITPAAFPNSTITPIKNGSVLEEDTICNDDDNYGRPRVYSPELISRDRWHDILGAQREKLEKLLGTVVRRQEALRQQEYLSENCDRSRLKRRPGILLQKKTSGPRYKLNLLRPKPIRRLPSINPQNAKFVRFDCTGVAVQMTLDGAVVIPIKDDLVGLPEIEAAFKVIPGVDPSLIPRDWIGNHFKWIVWKLACYESFTSDLEGCLSVENVVQQLKYRYDREIDDAQRPALRRIMEKDDAPQKRMVLCVSDILNMSDGNIELELTDGWYSIRTVLDDCLTSQVHKSRIKIGTKLVICGAELLNCDGCHPLEVSDSVRLKINANSTRRALWHAKLGYQPCPEPFPVRLESLMVTGGTVGRVKIFIARVYPVRYFEKQESVTVWRNKKAEERRAQDFEYEQQRKMDKIRDIIRRDYEMALAKEEKLALKDIDLSSISSIYCPKTLYGLYTNINDLDSLEELLSPRQKDLIMDYQRNKSSMLEQQVWSKIQDNRSNLRDVTPVLKLLVLDALSPGDKACVFQIWRPTDDHLQLKEGAIFSVFNVVLKRNGDLSSTSKTVFKPEGHDSSDFIGHKRLLLPISDFESTTKCLANECDTVGLVIRIDVNTFDQSLWLADPAGRLLQVKIFEGPRNCLLLDNLKRGQLVSVSNLILSPSSFEFAQAVANQSTVISRYPQCKYIQDSLNKFEDDLPKDLDGFVQQCAQKVSYYLDIIDVRGSSASSSSTLANSNLVNASDLLQEITDDTFCYSGITSTDIAMSMMDIDKFT